MASSREWIEPALGFDTTAGFQEKAARAEIFFHKGIVGDWQHGLSPTQIKTIIDQHGAVMQRFGYLDAHGQPITHFDQPET
jgi:hypothetical protein